MSDNPTTNDQNPNPVPPAPPTSDPETSPADEAPPTGTQSDEVPEWARRELEKARGEAANYRTKLRETEAELASKVQAETVAREKAEREVLREQVARRYALPDDLAALLQGDGPEQLESHAKTLAKYATTNDFEAPAARGGLDPVDSGGDDLDPGGGAKRIRAARY